MEVTITVLLMIHMDDTLMVVKSILWNFCFTSSRNKPFPHSATEFLIYLLSLFSLIDPVLFISDDPITDCRWKFPIDFGKLHSGNSQKIIPGIYLPIMLTYLTRYFHARFQCADILLYSKLKWPFRMYFVKIIES